jgi:protein-tyrosine phosphatase
VTTLDVSRILEDRLYQGAQPPEGVSVRDVGFTALVLCAVELQGLSCAGVYTIKCPLYDHEGYVLDEDGFTLAKTTSYVVARACQDGHRVLVTCAQGYNRSGLVTALTLFRLTGKPIMECVRDVRKARPGALGNDSFVRMLRTVA